MPSSLYPLRWVLILLIAFQVFWLVSDLLGRKGLGHDTFSGAFLDMLAIGF